MLTSFCEQGLFASVSTILPFCPGLPYQRCSASPTGRTFHAYCVFLVHCARCLDFAGSHSSHRGGGTPDREGSGGDGRRAGDGEGRGEEWGMGKEREGSGGELGMWGAGGGCQVFSIPFQA